MYNVIMTYIQGTQHQEEGAPRRTCAPAPLPPSFGSSRQFSYLYIKVSYHGVALPHLYTHTWLRLPMIQGTFFFACQDFLMSCNKDTSCHTHPTLPQSLPHPPKRCYLPDIVIFFLGDNLTLPQEANMYIIKKNVLKLSSTTPL